VTDIALGEVLWALVRATMYAASFIICMALLGDAGNSVGDPLLARRDPHELAFSCSGLAACTYIRSWQDFDLVSLVQMPLFLFSATFFPITLYPRWLGAIVSVSPALPIGTLLRGFSLGQFDWIMP
jgi:lipooligosaccharide transport system permease protein